jgi:hypothetical protein
METSTITTDDPQPLPTPRVIPIVVVCGALNVLVAMALIGLAMVALAPAPLRAAFIRLSLPLAIASTLLAAFTLGLLFCLRSAAGVHREHG